MCMLVCLDKLLILCTSILQCVKRVHFCGNMLHHCVKKDHAVFIISVNLVHVRHFWLWLYTVWYPTLYIFILVKRDVNVYVIKFLYVASVHPLE
jgi:hypothetical protein